MQVGEEFAGLGVDHFGGDGAVGQHRGHDRAAGFLVFTAGLRRGADFPFIHRALGGRFTVWPERQRVAAVVVLEQDGGAVLGDAVDVIRGTFGRLVRVLGTDVGDQRVFARAAPQVEVVDLFFGGLEQFAFRPLRQLRFAFFREGGGGQAGARGAAVQRRGGGLDFAGVLTGPVQAAEAVARFQRVGAPRAAGSGAARDGVAVEAARLAAGNRTGERVHDPTAFDGGLEGGFRDEAIGHVDFLLVLQHR